MSTALPISVSTRRMAPVTATAGQQQLFFNFPVVRDTDIRVTRTRAGGTAELAYGADFTVWGVSEPGGGTVTLAAGALAGDVYVVEGDALLDRLASVASNGRFSSAQIDQDFDLALIRDQELRRDSDDASARIDVIDAQLELAGYPNPNVPALFLRRDGTSAMTGPLRLSGNATAGLDAVPLRQLRAIYPDCVGDGTTDNRAIIQAALDNARNGGGGRVVLGAGIFRITGALTIYSNTTLSGMGIDATIIRLGNGVNATMITTVSTATLWGTLSEEGEQWWAVDNLTLDGNRANNTSGHGIYSFSRAFSLSNLKVINCCNNGIRLAWGDGASWLDSDAYQLDPFMEAKLSHVSIGYCGDEGLWMDGPHDSHLNNIIVALCSQNSLGTKPGVYIGPQGGGIIGTAVHSWGDTQSHAFRIAANYTTWFNCVADDAFTALVLVEADVFTWKGGQSFGAVFGTPTAQDKVLKGFVLGTSSRQVTSINIDCQVLNCPGGAVDFTFADSAGQGKVRVNGFIQSNIQTISTGLQTYGFIGNVPSNYDVDITILGVGNWFSLAKHVAAIELGAAGSAAFTALRKHGDLNTGLFFPADDKVALSAGGTRIVQCNADGSVYFATRSGTPTETWQAGMVYYDTATQKLRVYNGTAWIDLH